MLLQDVHAQVQQVLNDPDFWARPAELHYYYLIRAITQAGGSVVFVKDDKNVRCRVQAGRVFRATDPSPREALKLACRELRLGAERAKRHDTLSVEERLRMYLKNPDWLIAIGRTAEETLIVYVKHTKNLPESLAETIFMGHKLHIEVTSPSIP